MPVDVLAGDQETLDALFGLLGIFLQQLVKAFEGEAF